MDNTQYSLCKHCDHFVDENYPLEEGLAQFIHLEDGQQEFDHDAEPGETKSGDEWGKQRPDLFKEHADAVGPNSFFHDRRGKVDGLWYIPSDNCKLLNAETLFYTKRLGVADRLFGEYDFEPDVVKDTGAWENSGDTFKCPVYIENGDNPSIKKEFVVVFKPHTTQVVELSF